MTKKRIFLVTLQKAFYGFFDGGSADLYALKDISRLRCSNNSSRNSGDLGFAIERCIGAIISSNHAERNNSGQINFFMCAKIRIILNKNTSKNKNIYV